MSHSTQNPKLILEMQRQYEKRLKDDMTKLDPPTLKNDIQKELNIPYDNPYYEEAKNKVIGEYLDPWEWGYVALLKCHWATTNVYYKVYNTHCVLSDSHLEILKQINAAYQEVFKRLNAVRKRELFKEVR